MATAALTVRHMFDGNPSDYIESDDFQIVAPPEPAKTRLRGLGGFERETLSHSTQRIADALGVRPVTVRAWRAAERIPKMWWRAIRALMFGDLGVIHPAWKGWTITERGELASPDGGAYYFTPGEICASRLAAAQVAALQHELMRLRAKLAEPQQLPLV